MTDTTTTLTTEDESTMKAFQQVFDFVNKARDAVIQASSLAKEVAEMRAELNNLKSEIEEAHRKNADFEQQLAFVRQERDQALAHAQDWERQYVTANNNYENTKRELDLLYGRHSDTEVERNNLVVERDAAHMETRRLQEELDVEKRAHTKLRADIEAMYAKLQPQPRDTETGQFKSPYEGRETPKVVSGW